MKRPFARVIHPSTDRAVTPSRPVLSVISGSRPMGRVDPAHVTQAGGDVVAEFPEVESGKRVDRPQLAAALASCRTRRAVLVIASWIGWHVTHASCFP